MRTVGALPRTLARTLPRTLTARLVVTAVALVAVMALLLAVTTSLVMRSYLTEQLDDDVRGSLDRAYLPGPPGDFHDDRPGGDRSGGRGQGIGTLTAEIYPDDRRGDVLTDASNGPTGTPLDAEVLDVLAELPTDERVHEVDLPGLGSYRLIASDDAGFTAVAGLPTADLDDAVGRLVWVESLLVLLGLAAAGTAGTVVVRRQLVPLREVAATAHRVAELPLASGEIDLSDRVPLRLTDERTEVGQVGAALNAMLDHVESSLAQRHRSEQQVRQFVADASHELRTPLATIAGYTELARHRPETTATALDKVEVESARMTSLVEDLLLLARLDAGRPLALEPVDLSRLLLEAADDARVVDPERSWRLALPDAPVTVTGDEARLHQVVTNLLTNARTYTPPGSTVTVSGWSGGFTVHDDGPGFAPDLVPHAFERFTRGDAARHRAGGAGLGLSLVDAIVAAHGGTVGLTSAPGDTTVTVELPAAPSPTP